MSAKQTKIRSLLRENQHLKDNLKSAHRKIDILMAKGDQRLVEIDDVVDTIERVFSAPITWNELSPNPDGQLRQLKRSINRIREIAKGVKDAKEIN